MAKTIYDYWFTQFDFPDANGKTYRSSGGKMVWDETIKDYIPSNFTVKTVGELCKIYTGTEYANFAVKDGRYRFFSCSKDTLWCDKPAFQGKNLIVSTHGDFHIEHYDGDFNAYFCNAIVKPNDEMMYGLIYFAISRYLPILQRGSNGSIIKFIGSNEIKAIPVFVPDDLSILTTINKMLSIQEENDRESIKLTKLRDWLLPILMNGQATIAD